MTPVADETLCSQRELKCTRWRCRRAPLFSLGAIPPQKAQSYTRRSHGRGVSKYSPVLISFCIFFLVSSVKLVRHIHNIKLCANFGRSSCPRCSFILLTNRQTQHWVKWCIKRKKIWICEMKWCINHSPNVCAFLRGATTENRFVLTFSFMSMMFVFL